MKSPGEEGGAVRMERAEAEGVLDAAGRFSPRPRECFILRCAEGLEVAQVADALRISPAAVRVHLWRVRKALLARQRRQEEPQEPEQPEPEPEPDDGDDLSPAAYATVLWEAMRRTNTSPRTPLFGKVYDDGRFQYAEEAALHGRAVTLEDVQDVVWFGIREERGTPLLPFHREG